MNKFCVLFVFCIWYIHNSHQKPERCLLPPERGMCMARIPRLYYEPKNNTCNEFFYGGCGGNENSFGTLKDCDDICVKEIATTETGDKCSLRPHQGDCKASIPRLYYEEDTNTCEVFTYTGCGGNDNNFETKEQCQADCVKNTTRQVDCSLKPEVGMCKAMMPRLYYDTESNTCKEFIYGGCGGNSNNFQSVGECDKACVSMARSGAETYCYLAKAEGPCKGSNSRLYYDPRANTCKEFIYGGCEGNENNFDSFEQCERACMRKTSDNICTLNFEAGDCKGMIFRYYYNSATQTCGEFMYGGCGGNGNNFETLEECEDRCGNHAPVSIKSSFVILIVFLTHVFGKDILTTLSL